MTQLIHYAFDIPTTLRINVFAESEERAREKLWIQIGMMFRENSSNDTELTFPPFGTPLEAKVIK